MDEMKKNGKKLGTKKLAAVIGGGVALVAILVVILVCTLGKKEEAYRNIRVSEVTGTVLVNRDGMKELEAYANMNLLSGDEIVTKEGARLALRLDDDKYVILDEQSKLTLHATGTAEDSMTTLRLEYGAVFSDIKNKLSETSGYEVVTPASTMSVRGTQFEVVYRGGKVKVLTYEGAVYVVPEGTDEGRTVSAGQWDAVIEAADGTCEFEGETKTITTEDVGGFVSSYLEEGGITFEDKVTPTEAPVVTEEPVPTEKPIATPDTDQTATPSPKPTATPSPKPTAEEAVIRYYIPNPPKNLLPEGNTYSISYVNNTIVIDDGTNTDCYSPDVAPYATHTCTLEENVAPLIMEATNTYLPEALKTRLEEYHAETTVKCYFWCDATATQWFDWEKKLSSATLTDGGLNLYPLYTIHVPEQDGVREWYEISSVSVLITVEETGELFCLNLPAGATLKCKSTDGTTLQWIVNGVKSDTASAGHGTLVNLTLSVTK